MVSYYFVAAKRYSMKLFGNIIVIVSSVSVMVSSHSYTVLG